MNEIETNYPVCDGCDCVAGCSKVKDKACTRTDNLQHARDSAELRGMCQARDDARRQRDELYAQVATLNAQLEAVGDGGVGSLMGGVPAASFRPVCSLWVNPETLNYEVDHLDHPTDQLITAYVRIDNAEHVSPPQAELVCTAAQAVIDRWNSPMWGWHKQGPTADLMHQLVNAIAATPPAAPIAQTREPLTGERIARIVRNSSKGSAIQRDGSTSTRIVRAVEAAHGITGASK